MVRLASPYDVVVRSRTDTQILRAATERLRRFIDRKDSRVKIHVPQADLGELIILIMLVIWILPPTCWERPAYQVVEPGGAVFRGGHRSERAVGVEGRAASRGPRVRATVHLPELSAELTRYDNDRVRKKKLSEKLFRSKTSLGLIMFQITFLGLFFRAYYTDLISRPWMTITGSGWSWAGEGASKKEPEQLAAGAAPTAMLEILYSHCYYSKLQGQTKKIHNNPNFDSLGLGVEPSFRAFCQCQMTSTDCITATRIYVMGMHPMRVLVRVTVQNRKLPLVAPDFVGTHRIVNVPGTDTGNQSYMHGDYVCVRERVWARREAVRDGARRRVTIVAARSAIARAAHVQRRHYALGDSRGAGTIAGAWEKRRVRLPQPSESTASLKGPGARATQRVMFPSSPRGIPPCDDSWTGARI
ncbi:hypothetical protein GGX14DRAFT_662389 [Mycena pura]|uniref:Uncharacterized protein n=1 Tax=Mycena pura TaxID=153505 RepID=A0AAD6V0M6_9AGAR|nr:hypothetical protein GGX14DRAFT_662389 [Mycena pura]